MPSLRPAGGHFAIARGCAPCTTLSLSGRELRTTSPRAVGWPSITRICSVTTLSWIGDPISRATVVSVLLQSKCDLPRKKYAVYRPCVPSAVSPNSDDLETPVKNLLTRPGWRPALVVVGFVGLLPAPQGRADAPDFHHAPSSAARLENPYRGQASAAQAGGQLYASYCAACHGRSAQGNGNIPALAHARVQKVADGEVFWFITKGSNSGAMPSWASLPEQQRWQLVTYLKT